METNDGTEKLTKTDEDDWTMGIIEEDDQVESNEEDDSVEVP